MSAGIRTLLANTVAAHPVWRPRQRGHILNALGVDVDGGARVMPWVRFLGDVRRVRLGRGAFVNCGVVFGANADIEVGSRVHLGPTVMLLPTSHEIGPPDQRAGAATHGPISIGDGTWVGAAALVLGGVRLGRGVVVAAHSTVRDDVPENTVVGGTPARTLRTLDD